jgi:hypothetical protein
LDEQTRENWKKIKEKLEQSGKTDNMFYTRACKIVNGGVDPLGKLLDGD